MIRSSSRRRGRRFRTMIGAAAVAIGVVVAVGTAPAQASTHTADRAVEMTPELRDRIQEKIASFQAKYGIAGMSVAVVTPAPGGAEPVVTRFAVGVPTLGSATPVDSSTQFEIGSETKIFTTDLLTSLVAAGRVSLDDPVQKYAPAGITVPVWTDPQSGATTEITLRDLATHQAGLPDSPENYWEPCHNDPACINPQPDYTQRMLWRGLADNPLLWQPGTNWLYSNFGFGLLGTILANVIAPTPETDPPAYLPALQGAFLDDLGMSSTLLGTGPTIATPYASDNTPTFYWDDTNALAGEGGLVSDADDMATWVEAHLGYRSAGAPLGVRTMTDTLRPVSTITTMCSEPDPASCQPVTDFQMGLGWQLYPAASNGMGTDWAFKNGGTAGFSTDTTLAPSRGVGVTTMWNQGRPQGVDSEPGIELLSLILNFEPRPDHVPGDGDHGDHRDGRTHVLAESGSSGSAPLLAGFGGGMLVIAGGILVVRRRKHGAASR
ncbi:serine hydrolase [Leifsonia naganoensis]|uniref:D-alanyl-D-alanine-carboxypeptidase/D-alanyl-D-alanine-endopeptidase n=1 Tax=Leifsonia naganoensis TaxID=150025 RepID=A0A853DWI3_9MICO|nr:D-alanyl-D-alanine-carboxypeptidase/D-alanyl-D-alanine-endopeptidase [Leifsonia naganoensis]